MGYEIVVSVLLPLHQFRRDIAFSFLCAVLSALLCVLCLRFSVLVTEHAIPGVYSCGFANIRARAMTTCHHSSNPAHSHSYSMRFLNQRELLYFNG